MQKKWCSTISVKKNRLFGNNDKHIEKDDFMEQDIFEIKDGILINYRGNAEKVIIPDEVRMISYYAFENCVSVKAIVIPKTVFYVERAAFLWCTELESIVVEVGNPVYHSAGNCLIETSANVLVAGCKTSVIPSITGTIGPFAFYNCVGLTEIEIPESVSFIRQFAFCRCTSLVSIRIPWNVREIENFAFVGNNLQSISVDEDNVNYHSIGNCLIETAMNSLVAGCQNSCIPDDDSVTMIDAGAFSECINLKSIYIPKGVRVINSSAFSGCIHLESVIISDGVKSIVGDAFYGCDILKHVVIPESITEIEDYAFQNCPVLEIEARKFSCAAEYALKNNISLKYIFS